MKHDLMEIIAPSSLEYPPGEEELNRKQGLTWKVHVLLLHINAIHA